MKHLDVKVYVIKYSKGNGSIGLSEVRASGFNQEKVLIGFYSEVENHYKTERTYFKWFSAYSILSIEIKEQENSLHLEFMKRANMLLDMEAETPKKKKKVHENYVKYD